MPSSLSYARFPMRELWDLLRWLIDSVLYSALRVDGTSYETVCELYRQL